MRQTLSFFAKAAELHIFHRDIKPDNVFLDGNGQIKIGDFGCAKIGAQANATQTIKGTRTYLSPQKLSALGGTSGTVKEDTEKGDVWSLGVTFLFMVTLEKPKNITHQRLGPGKIQKELLKTAKYSDLVRYVIWQMLQVDQAKRWNFAQLSAALEKVKEHIPHTNLSPPDNADNDERLKIDLIKPPEELIVEQLCMEFADAVRPSDAFFKDNPAQSDPPVLLQLISESKKLMMFNLETQARDDKTIYRLPFEFTGTSWVMLDSDTVLFAGACDEERTLRDVCTYHFVTEKLTSRAPMLQARIGHAMIRAD